MTVRLLPRPATPDHEAGGIARKGRQVLEHVAPARKPRVVHVQPPGAPDKGLEPPPQQREVEVRVGHGREFRRVRGRQVIDAAAVAFDIRQVIADRTAQQRIHAIAQQLVVHRVAVVFPVVEHRPRQVAHLVRRVARGVREVHRPAQVGSRTAADRRGLAPQPLRDVFDECRRVAVEVAEERLAQPQPVRAKERRVGELDVEVPPDARPRRVAIPRAREVENRPVGAHGGAEFVELNPVVSLESRVGKRDEAEGIVRMPPRACSRRETNLAERLGGVDGALRLAQRIVTGDALANRDIKQFPAAPRRAAAYPLGVRTLADERLDTRDASGRRDDRGRLMQLFRRERFLAGDFSGRSRLGRRPAEVYGSGLGASPFEFDHDH